MKTTLIRCIGALLFGLLFYNQDLGLNMVIFSLVAITAVFIVRPTLLRRKPFLMAAALYLVSAIFVFTVNSLLAITTCIFTFIVFAGSISGFHNSVYVQWLNGIYQSSLGGLHHRIDTSTSTVPARKSKHNYGFILLTIVIVVTLVSLFASLYGQANPILGEWIASINLDAINVQWMLTTLMGYYLLLNITSTAELDILTTADRKASTSLVHSNITEEREHVLKKELVLGSILLVALNALILLFIATDIWYIFQDPLADAPVLSKTVHQGVNALIISIIIAITTILILFRGDLNFYKKSNTLRALTYLWIALNIVIILSTAYKNYMYSSGFGLTYKRIGVFVYLTLCISGLIITYFKIARKHNFLFTIQANARVAFILMIVISSFSWDRTITAYNLRQVASPDIQYLLTMSDTNGDLLHAFAKANPKKNMNRKRIEERYQQHLKSLSKQTWQSKTLRGILNPKIENYDVTETETSY